MYSRKSCFLSHTDWWLCPQLTISQRQTNYTIGRKTPVVNNGVSMIMTDSFSLGFWVLGTGEKKAMDCFIFSAVFTCLPGVYAGEILSIVVGYLSLATGREFGPNLPLPWRAQIDAMSSVCLSNNHSIIRMQLLRALDAIKCWLPWRSDETVC